MAWVGVLLLLYLVVGLRRRETAGARHVFIAVATALVLAVVYLQPAALR